MSFWMLSGHLKHIFQIYSLNIIWTAYSTGDVQNIFCIYSTEIQFYILMNMNVFWKIPNNFLLKFEYILDILLILSSRPILCSSLLPYDSQWANKARAFLCISSLYLFKRGCWIGVYSRKYKALDSLKSNLEVNTMVFLNIANIANAVQCHS